jgi:hypothetical protein
MVDKIAKLVNIEGKVL